MTVKELIEMLKTCYEESIVYMVVMLVILV